MNHEKRGLVAVGVHLYVGGRQVGPPVKVAVILHAEQRIRDVGKAESELRFLDSGPSACDVGAIEHRDPQVQHLLALATRCTEDERPRHKVGVRRIGGRYLQAGPSSGQHLGPELGLYIRKDPAYTVVERVGEPVCPLQ
ncbi:MAG: hypothetical protein WCG47_19310 [Dermatophilaceae bacterium]